VRRKTYTTSWDAAAIAASAHVRCADFVRLHRLVQDGDLAEARALSRELAALSAALFAEPNPAVIKGLLARQGWLSDELRAPMLPASRGAIDRAEALSRR